MSLANGNHGEKVWLRIIQINDVYELKHFPHFKSLVQAHQDGPDKVLVVLAGDFLAPSLLSSLDKGRGMVDCMNLAGVTHVCFGNHETDIPMKDLKQRIMVDSQFAWINTNMRELDDNLDVETLPHEIIQVTNESTQVTKKVALLGLLTEDPSVYRPGVFAGATIDPIVEATEDYLATTLTKIDDLDLVIPLTHQRMNDDRVFMRKFGSKFPIILGGHDHEVYDETINGSRIIKTGQDAVNTAIHDIVWDNVRHTTTNGFHPSLPTIQVTLIPTDSYPADDEMQYRVSCHERILEELNRAKLFRFCDWLPRGKLDLPFTTRDNRLGLDNGTKVLASLMRMGMRADCGLINAGNIRGGQTYPVDQEWFTWSDLKAEIPFTVGITAVRLPGQVIEDIINDSRSMARQDPPVTSGGYVHTCDLIDFDETEQKIIMIRGKEFRPDKLYLTAFPANWFEGMDGHTPLLKWAKGTPFENAKESSSKPMKEVIVETFSALLWLELGSFQELDTNGDGFITQNEVREAANHIFGDDVADLVVDNVFSVADCDGDGKISPLDMMVVKFVAEDIHNHVPTAEEMLVLQKVAAETLDKNPTDEEVRSTLQTLRQVLDKDNNGRITRAESMGVIGEVRRRSLLR